MAVLLIGLGASASYFSYTLIKKEIERAAISRTQLADNLALQYRSIAEEMWTANYESIAQRISNISQQTSRGSYEIYLASPEGTCVFYESSTSSANTTCAMPKKWRSAFMDSMTADTVQISPRFDNDIGQYSLEIPLYVGPIHKGYLFAHFSDPYHFYHGNPWKILGTSFAPAIICILFFWAIWLLFSLRHLVNPYLENLLQLERNEAFTKMAQQVAHDIRAPLAALRVAIADTENLATNLPLVGLATDRIAQIADDLLAFKKIKEIGRHKILELVIEVIQEKRLQYQNAKLQITVDTEFQGDEAALLEPVTFKRLLSNLIDNAAESIATGAGKIQVSLSRVGGTISLNVKDNGSGIPQFVLEKLGKEQISFGKKNGIIGNGMGVHHAFRAVTSWGGSMSYDSCEMHGTTATVTLRPDLKET